jgi:hypothetical protein
MDVRGVVSGKRFEYCVFEGPGLIMGLSGTDLSGLEFPGPAPIENYVWTAPGPAVIGPVGLEYCQFLQCRMVHIAFAASPKQAPYIRKMLAGEIKGFKIGKSEDDITVIE